MSAVRITIADAGYTLPVVTAGGKVVSNCLNSFNAKFSDFIGIFII